MQGSKVTNLAVERHYKINLLVIISNQYLQRSTSLLFGYNLVTTKLIFHASVMVVDFAIELTKLIGWVNWNSCRASLKGPGTRFSKCIFF